MGKKEKIYLENGKVAQNPVTNYWNKQKSKEMQKNKERAKKIFAEKQEQIKQYYAQQAVSKEHEGDDIYNRDKINTILAEKEKRRMGQYDSHVSLNSLQGQNENQADGKKMIFVPGHGMIDATQVSKNRKVIQKTKEIHVAKEERSKLRKERDEKIANGEKITEEEEEKFNQAIQKTYGVQYGTKKPQTDKNNKLDFNVITPEQVKEMIDSRKNHNLKKNQNPDFKKPMNPHIQQKKNMEQNKKNDPFYKLTEDEDYDPQQKKQIENCQIYLDQTQNALLNGGQMQHLPPPLQPREISQEQTQEQYNQDGEIQQSQQVEQMETEGTNYQEIIKPAQITQQQQPQSKINVELLDKQPVPQKPLTINQVKDKNAVEYTTTVEKTVDQKTGQYKEIITSAPTVKKSKIDLTQNKKLFVPHNLMKQKAVGIQDARKAEPAIKNTQTEKEYQQFLDDLHNQYGE